MTRFETAIELFVAALMELMFLAKAYVETDGVAFVAWFVVFCETWYEFVQIVLICTKGEATA